MFVFFELLKSLSSAVAAVLLFILAVLALHEASPVA